MEAASQLGKADLSALTASLQTEPQYYYGSSPDAASMQKRALTSLASGALWAAVAQTDYEANKRKMVQYGMLTFVFHSTEVF